MAAGCCLWSASSVCCCAAMSSAGAGCGLQTRRRVALAAVRFGLCGGATPLWFSPHTHTHCSPSTKRAYAACCSQTHFRTFCRNQSNKQEQGGTETDANRWLRTSRSDDGPPALMMQNHSLCARLDERTLLKSTNSTGLRRGARCWCCDRRLCEGGTLRPAALLRSPPGASVPRELFAAFSKCCALWLEAVWPRAK